MLKLFADRRRRARAGGEVISINELVSDRTKTASADIRTIFLILHVSLLPGKFVVFKQGGLGYYENFPMAQTGALQMQNGSACLSYLFACSLDT